MKRSLGVKIFGVLFIFRGSCGLLNVMVIPFMPSLLEKAPEMIAQRLASKGVAEQQVATEFQSQAQRSPEFKQQVAALKVLLAS